MSKYKISIIVAIFNNGTYLRDRCVNSLKKSSMFKDMEILLIDDGSTDNETVNIVKKLETENENIKSYIFPTGGSGNAARPRNFGITLATSDYITYLDPDNEAVNDGYYKLYKELENNDFDMILGNYQVVSDNERKIANYYNACAYYGFNCREISDTKNLLIKNSFNVDSIQAILIKKDLVLNNNVIMEGIGEDTVFFHEIMLLSKKIRVIDEVIHLYYVNREGSLTNEINNRYFEGHFLAQKRKKNVFENGDVLQEYLKLKQEIHFKYYLYDKLNYAHDKEYARDLLYKMYDVFEGKWQVMDKDLKEFFYNRK